MPKKILEPIGPIVEQQPNISDIPSESEPEEEPKSKQKSEKPRSQAQIDAFAKVVEKHAETRKMRAETREKEATIVKAKLEKMI